jgi:hypothetical protein
MPRVRLERVWEQMLNKDAQEKKIEGKWKEGLGGEKSV